MAERPDTEAEGEYRELQSDEWRDPDEPNTFPSGETLREDRREAASAHDADRPPTPEEEEAAERNELDPDVAEAYREATERGVEQQGEGRLP